MKMSEFYTNYFIIELPDGTILKPIMTEKEKEIFDIAEALGVTPYCRVFTRRHGWKYVIHPDVEIKLNTL